MHAGMTCGGWLLVLELGVIYWLAFLICFEGYIISMTVMDAVPIGDGQVWDRAPTRDGGLLWLLGGSLYLEYLCYNRFGNGWFGLGNLLGDLSWSLAQAGVCWGMRWRRSHTPFLWNRAGRCPAPTRGCDGVSLWRGPAPATPARGFHPLGSPKIELEM
jgi:hypothetical protein